MIPNSVLLPEGIDSDLYNQVIADPGTGLASTIRAGLVSFPEAVKYINWLWDDNSLKPESLETTSQVLQNDRCLIQRP